MELLYVIPKVAEQLLKKIRNNGRRSEEEKKPEQARAQIIHKYPTRQHQNYSPTPRVKTQTRRPRRPPRVDPSETHMDTP